MGVATSDLGIGFQLSAVSDQRGTDCEIEGRRGAGFQVFEVVRVQI
jgi:hypothetical protein